MQTQGENLKAFQAKFATEVKLLEAGYCKFPLRSTTKINKRQSALRWRVELPKCYILEAKANSFVEATIAFVEKVSIKEHRGLASL